MPPFTGAFPCVQLDPRVISVPIVPGCEPSKSYGDLFGRGVRGIVLHGFGVGNSEHAAVLDALRHRGAKPLSCCLRMHAVPDERAGWLPWLKDQRKKGLQVYLRSQSSVGRLRPELYRSGAAALKLGVESGPQLTQETAVVKMMLTLKYPDIPMGMPLAGEL